MLCSNIAVGYNNIKIEHCNADMDEFYVYFSKNLIFNLQIAIEMRRT